MAQVDLVARYNAQYTPTPFTTAMLSTTNVDDVLARQLTQEIQQLYEFYGYPAPHVEPDAQYREDVYRFVLTSGYRFDDTAHANAAFVRQVIAPLTGLLREEKEHASRLHDARSRGRSETYLRQYSTGGVANPDMEYAAASLRTADRQLSHPDGNQRLSSPSMTQRTPGIDAYVPRL